MHVAVAKILQDPACLFSQKHTHYEDARLDRVLREKQSQDKARTDKMTSTLNASLTSALKNKLDHLVRSEIKNIVLPCKSLSEHSYKYISYLRFELSQEVHKKWFKMQLTGRESLILK